MVSNWEDLRVFQAAVSAGTYAKAGRELGVNATTVARRVASLEEAVGAKLVKAHSRGLIPTEEGEELYAAAERMADELHDAHRRVSGRDTRLTGTLRFTTITMLAQRHVGAFAAFSQTYPGLCLELSCDPNYRDLTRREADVALRFTAKPAPHLVGTKVAGLRYDLYAARSTVEALGGVSIDAIGELPWVAWDERAGATEQETWRRRHAPNARVAARLGSAVMLVAAVRAGLGIAFLVRTVAEQYSDLVPLGVDPGWEDPLWLLTHPDLRRSPKVRAFLDFVGPRIRAVHGRD